MSQQLLRKYRVGFSLRLRSLRDSSSTRLRYLECFLSRYYTVRKPVNIFSKVLLRPVCAQNLLKFQTPKRFSVYICPSVSLLSLSHLLVIHLFSSSLKKSSQASKCFWCYKGGRCPLALTHTVGKHF